MKVFFTTRAAMRNANFGTKLDLGAATEKRWARSIDASISVAETRTAYQGEGRDRRPFKNVPVTVKKTRRGSIATIN